MNKKLWLLIATLLLAAIAIAACQPQTVEVEVTRVVEVEGEEVVVTEIVEVPVTVEVEVEGEAEAAPARDTLVICQGQEPDTLYLYGGSMLAARHVQEAVYDGPIDNRTFAYQAVILEKLPSLDDGDAAVNVVEVAEGDTVVDNAGNPVVLEAGVEYRPAGCRAADCAVAYEGGTVEMDQMTATFKILEGVTWSDGEPVTADDSVYSFELYMDPDTPNPSRYAGERTASYVAEDDLTAVWTGLPGYIDSTFFVNFFTPLPRHAWGGFSPVELIEAEESSRMPIGWGPYVIEEWASGDFIRMSKNEFYFRADEGLPAFETVIFRFVGANSNANIASLLAGDCDIVDQTSSLEDQSELLLELQAQGEVNATFVTGTVWEHADFIMDPVDEWDGFSATGAFQDVRLRQAIATCMDRQAVVDSVLFGQSVVLDTFLPPEHPLFNPDVVSYAYDPEAAAALFDEIGWVDDDGDPATPRVAQGVSFEGLDGSTITIPDGTALSFKYGTTNATQRQQATQVLQQSMAECGIGVELEYYVAGEWFADGPEGPLFGRRYDLGQFAWLTGVQPPCNLYLGGNEIPSEANGWAGQNNTGWYLEEYNNVCNAAIQSLPGTESEAENHLLAQEIFAENLPVVPLYLRLKLAASRPDVQGFIMDPTNNSEFWNIESFSFSE